MIASDHGGWELKEKIKAQFPMIQWIDFGPSSDTSSVDYPDFADKVCEKISSDDTEPRALLLCGSGQGMAMRANKYPFVRAALVWNLESTKLAREHNAANILCLGGRLLDHQLAFQCVQIFLSTPFAGGRHQNRIEKLNKPTPNSQTHKE